MSVFRSEMRINRYLSACGFGARRAVERLVTEGRVRINGAVVEALHARVAPGDRVEVDGRAVEPAAESVYVALFKPPGFETSHSPRGGRPSVFRLLPEEFARLRYAGRLDAESRGLLLLSNDGAFVQAVTHPSGELTKTYLVRLRGPMDREVLLRRFTEGIRSEGELLRARSARFRPDGTLELVLAEGRNRQIRRMARALGLHVEDLLRVRIGALSLDTISLKPGAFVRIAPEQVLGAPVSEPGARAAGVPKAPASVRLEN